MMERNCRCPNPQACSYSGRQEKLHSFAVSIACHDSKREVDGTVVWTAAESCRVSVLAESLRHSGDRTVNLTLADEWMDMIPQCAPGYRGLLCGQCMPGFGHGQASSTCTACPSNLVSAAVVLAVILAMLLVSWYTIHQASMTTVQVGERGSSSCEDMVSHAHMHRASALHRTGFKHDSGSAHRINHASTSRDSVPGRGCSEGTELKQAHPPGKHATVLAGTQTTNSGSHMEPLWRVEGQQSW